MAAIQATGPGMTWLSRAVERRHGGAVNRYLAEMEPYERLALREARARLLGDLTGRILEIGAGCGASFHAYSAAADVTAIEPDPAFRSAAQREAKTARARIRVMDGDAHRLDLAGATFDGAVSSMVLCSLENPGAALSEMRRLLKPASPARFLEHVQSSHRSVAAMQRWCQPAWHFFDGSSCSLIHDSLSDITHAGLAVDRSGPIHLPGLVGVFFPVLEIYARVI